MCGIVGFISESSRYNESVLRDMTDVLAHRGPDGGGYKIFQRDQKKVGIGHRRLSIIDVSSRSSQPMEVSSIWIVFNGEVYNYKEIRVELEAKGHKFRTASDTEVVLRSYLEWGIQSVQKFIGMFAYAIYDKKEDNVYLVRDRVGVKPLYYYSYKSDFGFGSELKVFSEYPDFKKEIDVSALSDYFYSGYISAPKSIFKNVHKILPGSYIQYEIGAEKITEQKYWEVSKQSNSNTFAQNKEELRDLLADSFHYRLISDVPVGVFLSGGFDSTIVTSILQSNLNTKLDTFTMGFYNKEYDEAPQAKQIAKYLGTNHHEYYIDGQEAINILENDYINIYDEPFGDSSGIPTIMLSRETSNHVKVALSADGGDELFGGYSIYTKTLRMKRLFDYLPTTSPSTLKSIVKHILEADSKYIRQFHPIKKRLEDSFAILSNPTVGTIHSTLASHYSRREVQTILDKLPSVKYYDDKISPIKQQLLTDFQLSLPDDMLVKVDRATMASGLEGRDPLLDHRIADFAFSLPDKHLVNQGVKKYIIRELVYDYVPKAIMDQKKRGFTVPIQDWLFNDLKYSVMYYLDQENVNTRSIINPEYIEMLKYQLKRNNKKYAIKIWLMYVFQMWYSRWVQD
jgi:asparagine synthase (glutamine-hydrolysing)